MTYSVKYGNLEKFMNSENLEKGEQNGMTKNEILQLLCQFGQIVFYGPPGTGKTRAAKLLLPELIGADKWESLQGDRWDIVQFHPSYNYEDFVRGVQVETDTNGNAVYETVNRIFGEMCERAADDSENYYALIIDEINRANVSAVLGELIYALEYRGDEVQTPYLVNGKRGIIVPEKLYIIGTMNTADRTIGQIDYAVRRRFAFVHIAPDREVVNSNFPRAIEIYDMVRELFDAHLSPDFDAEDVRIGHSYFLADGAKLGNKIIYQVVPILREYVRDGVLLPESEKVIKEIEERAKKLSAGESETDSSAKNETGGKQYFYWRNGDRSDISVRQRAGFLIARDFIREEIKKNSDINLEALKEAFAPDGRGSLSKIFRLQSDVANYKNSYYNKDKELVQLPNGEKICISSGWHDGHKNKWNDFRAKAKEYGYSIGQCHLVNVGENDGNDPRARSWDDCHKHGFVSGRGVGYKASIEKIKKGDFVFVRIAEAQEGKNGFIACAEVLEEAVHIAEFRTAEGGLLADYDVGGGQTYREKYPNAFAEDYPDYAVRVKWLPGIKSRNDTVQISSAVRKLRVGKINQNDFAKLRNAFDLPGFDK